MSRCRSFWGAIDAGGPDDESESIGRIEFAQDLSQLPPRLLVVDLATDADPLQAGHQHQVATGDADVGRKRRSLGTDPFLDDLHQHFAAALKDLLDRRLVAGHSAR